MIKDAMFYDNMDDSTVRCHLCRHMCIIDDGKSGICNVRANKNGKLIPIFYNRPIAMAEDPIEKKPLYHFLPASTSLSIATMGCNFRCAFCQNWNISQYDEKTGISFDEISPDEVVNAAISKGCKSIAYTYTEPTIFFEYAYDITRIAHEKGLANIFVSNGYMTRDAIDAIAPYLDAANIDLKCFSDETYRNIMGARLEGVLDSIKHIKKSGIWLEITTLIVPNMNDGMDEISDIARFIAKIGVETPWHISRFHPDYKMNNGYPTPIETMKAAYDIGKSVGLNYVYLGNIVTGNAENTYCKNCGKALIERSGYMINSRTLTDAGTCPSCGTRLDGVF